MDCIPDTVLVEFLGGSLSDKQLKEVHTHLDRCSPCRQLVAELARNPDTVEHPCSERYRLLDMVGEGGMGVVYAAFDTTLNRKVAVKLLHQDGNDDTSSLQSQRLLREAQALAQLSHPNIVIIHDVGTMENNVFLAMEFVEGQPVSEWIRSKDRTVREIVEVYIGAAKGLHAAHERGLVHRDFKPSNVLVGGDGGIKVTDFGLARIIDPIRVPSNADALGLSASDACLLKTQTGTMLGTPAYMAPEQFVSGQVDAKADQFSFWVSLFEGLVGHRPFWGHTIEDMLDLMKAGQIDWSSAGAARLSPRLKNALSRGLQYCADERYEDMDTVVEVLADVIRPRWQRRAVALGATAFVFIVAALVAVRGQTSAACTGGKVRIAGIWNATSRDALASSFQASGLPYGEQVLKTVNRDITRYNLAWAETHHAVCMAHRNGEQSGAALDQKMNCLSSRFAELEALLRSFSHGGASIVENAVEAVSKLPSPTQCEGFLQEVGAVTSLGAESKELESIRRSLGEAFVLLASERGREGVPMAKGALEAARKAGHLELEMQAILLLGQLTAVEESHQESEQYLFESFVASEKLGARTIRAQAAISLVDHFVRLGKFPEATQWGQIAEAAVSGSSDGDMRGRLHLTLGKMAVEQGDIDSGLRHATQALQTWTVNHGKQHPQVAAALSQLSVLSRMKGNGKSALAYGLDATKIYEELLGPMHPAVGRSLSRVCTYHYRLDDFEAAETVCRRAVRILEASKHNGAALASAIGNLVMVLDTRGKLQEASEQNDRVIEIFEEVYGPNHPLVAKALVARGDLLIVANAIDDAARDYERALEIRQDVFGPAHSAIASALASMAQVEHRRGNLEEALAYAQRAAAMIETLHGADYAHLAPYLTDTGVIMTELGRAKDARPLLERALHLRLDNDASEVGTAITRFALAQALSALRQEPSRALELVNLAQTVFLSLGDRAKEEIQAVEDWREKYQRGPARGR